MNTPSTIASRALGIVLSASAAFITSGGAHSADSPPGATAHAAGETRELGEVLVRGNNLSRLIEDAEAEYFRLYSKINEKNEFDVRCADVRADRNSLAFTRTCLPIFLGTFHTTVAIPPGDGIYRHWSGFSTSGTGGVSAVPGIGGQPVYSTQYSRRPWSSPEIRSTSQVALAPRTPQVEQQRQEFARNLVRVTYSDPQLLDKATSLAALYDEWNDLQEMYALAQAQEQTRKDAVRRERAELRRERMQLRPIPDNPRF